MALMDEVAAICHRLAPLGWGELFLRHGLDLTASDLQSELLRPLKIDRFQAGFEDFAADAVRAIEPGKPSRSLLYHALASPNVEIPGEPGDVMPTLAEIRTVENLVYGSRPPSLAQLRGRFPGARLAIAVFAYDYRPAGDTVHRRHADLCFSRTGVARVGTQAAVYDRAARGFAAVAADPHVIPVQPARYGAFVAAQLRGDQADFGPMNSWVREMLFGEVDASGDRGRSFWVPLHKLFSGDECLADQRLNVSLTARHRNEKLRRIHLRLSPGTGDVAFDIPPFTFEDRIAEFLADADLGEGVLMPVVHERLLEPATRNGVPLTFRVPEDGAVFVSSLNLQASGNGHRSAPEFVHVRHRLAANGTLVDLNDDPEVADRVAEGGFEALHYVDFTGDGIIEAQCSELAAELVRSVPAYSVVAAPDFFPNCSQRELLEWWLLELPSGLRERIWVGGRFPTTLADHRLPPNLQFPGANFRAEDTTVSAVVSMPGPPAAEASSGRRRRRAYVDLPDAAAGVFAPGWDISLDGDGDTTHLSAYGLGSPFPEDAKLCAALSAFWPAASPDAGRSFSQQFRTVTPQSDGEIGTVGDLPWDGITGPVQVAPGKYRFASFAHVDYVNSALAGHFSTLMTAAVDTREYIARTLALVRLYTALNISADDISWRLLSFQSVPAHNAELRDAEREAGRRIVGQAFRCILGHAVSERPDTDDHTAVLITTDHEIVALVGATATVLAREDTGPWQAHDP
jgi:hypothetical protein